MRNRFNLNESEKNRIRTLHGIKTLNEQVVGYGEQGLDEREQYMNEDDDKDTWWESIKQKLAGVNAEQAAYNKEYGLPSTWRGSKEGYHEHITNKKFHSGSN